MGTLRRFAWACGLAAAVAGGAQAGAATAPDRLERLVRATVRRLMAKDQIPGMAVGVIANGREREFHFGLAAIEPNRPVADDTLFELGSISKTFTATLASWEQVRGHLSLADPVERYLPVLRGHPFGRVTLLELGTHTPGGLPLQVPETIHDEAELMRYFEAWQPAYPPGTVRTYSNPGIGTLGLIVAKHLRADFSDLEEGSLLPALGMRSTYIRVPADRMGSYAEGYTQLGKPVRMKGDVVAPEAYGLKSTAADMMRYLEINLGLVQVGGELQRAIQNTHTGYFQVGPMTQDLIWEQYPFPVALKDLEYGNSSAVNTSARPVSELHPPLPPRGDVWINKTGSTNGFGAYVAFIPERRTGIVLLANKNYALEDRVAAAHRILTALLAP